MALAYYPAQVYTYTAHLPDCMRSTNLDDLRKAFSEAKFHIDPASASIFGLRRSLARAGPDTLRLELRSEVLTLFEEPFPNQIDWEITPPGADSDTVILLSFYRTM